MSRYAPHEKTPLYFFRKTGKAAKNPATTRNRVIANDPVCPYPGKNLSIPFILREGEKYPKPLQEKP